MATKTLEEISPNARNDLKAQESVWEYYNQQARAVDKDLLKDWDGNMDVLLIFAALFSGILTAFVTDTYKRLQLRDTQILLAISAQLAGTRKDPIVAEAFTPDPRDVAMNAIFFASISCSLITAMGAMLVKQWVRNYAQGLEAIQEPRLRALARHRRFVEAFRWKLPGLVGFLPIVMQLALTLFFTGLGILLFHNSVIFSIVLIFFGIGAAVLCTSVVISTLIPDAPFRTPVSGFMRWLPVVLRKSTRRFLPVHEPKHTGAESSVSPEDPKPQWEALEWLAKKTFPSQGTSKIVDSIITATGEFPGMWKNMKGKVYWERLVDHVLDSSPGAGQDRGPPLRALLLVFSSTDPLDMKDENLLRRTRDALYHTTSSLADCWSVYLYDSLEAAGRSGDQVESSILRTLPFKTHSRLSSNEITLHLESLRDVFARLFPPPYFERSDLDTLLREYLITPSSDGILSLIAQSAVQTDRFKIATHIMKSWPSQNIESSRKAFYLGLLRFLLATAWSDFPRISPLESPPSGDVDPKPLGASLEGSPLLELANTVEPSLERVAELKDKTDRYLHDYLRALEVCIAGLGGIKEHLRVDLLHALASVMARCSQDDVAEVLHIFSLATPAFQQIRIRELFSIINSLDSGGKLQCYVIFMSAIYARRNGLIEEAKTRTQELKQEASVTLCLLLDIPLDESFVPPRSPGIKIPMTDDHFWCSPEMMLEMNRRFGEMEKSPLQFNPYDLLFLRAAMRHKSESMSFHRKALRNLARAAQGKYIAENDITETFSNMVIDKWIGAEDSRSTLVDMARLDQFVAKAVFLRACTAWNQGLSDTFPHNVALMWINNLAELQTSLTSAEINEIINSPIFRSGPDPAALAIITAIALNLKLKNGHAIQNSACFRHLKAAWKHIADSDSPDPTDLEALVIMSARKWLRDETVDSAGIWKFIVELAGKQLVPVDRLRGLWESQALQKMLSRPHIGDAVRPFVSRIVKADTGLTRAFIDQGGLDWLKKLSSNNKYREWAADTLTSIVEREYDDLLPQVAEKLITLSAVYKQKNSPSIEDDANRWLDIVQKIAEHHPDVVLQSRVLRDITDHALRVAFEELKRSESIPHGLQSLKTLRQRANHIQDIIEQHAETPRLTLNPQRSDTSMTMTAQQSLFRRLATLTRDRSPV